MEELDCHNSRNNSKTPIINFTGCDRKSGDRHIATQPMCQKSYVDKPKFPTIKCKPVRKEVLVNICDSSGLCLHSSEWKNTSCSRVVNDDINSQRTTSSWEVTWSNQSTLRLGGNRRPSYKIRKIFACCWCLLLENYNISIFDWAMPAARTRATRSSRILWKGAKIAVSHQRLTKQNVICCAGFTVGWCCSIVDERQCRIILSQSQTVVLERALLICCRLIPIVLFFIYFLFYNTAMRVFRPEWCH